MPNINQTNLKVINKLSNASCLMKLNEKIKTKTKQFDVKLENKSLEIRSKIVVNLTFYGA